MGKRRPNISPQPPRKKRKRLFWNRHWLPLNMGKGHAQGDSLSMRVVLRAQFQRMGLDDIRKKRVLGKEEASMQQQNTNRIKSSIKGGSSNV